MISAVDRAVGNGCTSLDAIMLRLPACRKRVGPAADALISLRLHAMDKSLGSKEPVSGRRESGEDVGSYSQLHAKNPRRRLTRLYGDGAGKKRRKWYLTPDARHLAVVEGSGSPLQGL